MYHIDLDKPVKVHFIGIGGISMSGLAEILLDRGFTVSGSDTKASPLTDKLKGQGATIYTGQSASNIDPSLDVVIYTAAIGRDNPEFLEASASGIPMLTRAQLLGELMANYKTAIGIAGTHGKTTTTSMISEILLASGKDPTISVGGMLSSIGGNVRIGHSDTFIAEACEYTNSFLSLAPTVEVILNIQEDHLDFFKDINDIRHSFHKYAELLDEKGTLVINNEIPDVSEIYEGCKAKIVTFGENGDYSASNIKCEADGCYSYDLMCRKGDNSADYENLGHIKLGVPGVHNVFNSLAAVAVARSLSSPMDVIIDTLAHFTGADRRFQKKGVVNGFTIIDDYAHHPTEIAATLKAATAYPHNKLVCIFQPHTYTRTKAFLDDFAKALSMADEVILADIYAAREKNTIGVSSQDIKERIDALGTACTYLPSFEEIEKYVLANFGEGDLVITMGAGNIVNVGEDLLTM